MSGKKVTVRKQKIKKNHIREKLILLHNTDTDLTYCCRRCQKTLSV